MGRRVLTIYELSFHEKRKRNPASYAPADLNGEDLLDIFQTWVKNLTTQETHNEDRQTWVSLAKVSLYAPRVLLLDLRVGTYGEAATSSTSTPAIRWGTSRTTRHRPAATAHSFSSPKRASERTSCRKSPPADGLADASETCSAPTSADTPTR